MILTQHSIQSFWLAIAAFPSIANLLEMSSIDRFDECTERWFVPPELQNFPRTVGFLPLKRRVSESAG